jgi:hypothetical protein
LRRREPNELTEIAKAAMTNPKSDPVSVAVVL